jgi:glycosyltransferase involved in cell wall biosynthesis
LAPRLRDPLQISSDRQALTSEISGKPRDFSTINAVILIPAYNASSTIASTLDAVQSNPELQWVKAVIVLDDASSDGTADAAKHAWQSSVPLEIWANRRNAGQWATANCGFHGLPPEVEWAFVLHADDVVKANWISLYLNEMINCPNDVATICSSYDRWYPESGRVDSGEEFPDRPVMLIEGTRAAVADALNRGCWWHISGCAIRTRAFRLIGEFNPDMPYSSDWEWLLRCLAKGFSILYLPRSTMLYRQHMQSVSSNSFRQGWDIGERLQILDLYRGYLSPINQRREIRRVIYHLCRRTLVRAIRRDLMGVRQHASLLARTLAKYLLGRI